MEPGETVVPLEVTPASRIQPILWAIPTKTMSVTPAARKRPTGNRRLAIQALRSRRCGLRGLAGDVLGETDWVDMGNALFLGIDPQSKMRQRSTCLASRVAATAHDHSLSNKVRTQAG